MAQDDINVVKSTVLLPPLAGISADLTEKLLFPVGEAIVNSSPKVWGR